jgi:hypothetical protein
MSPDWRRPVVVTHRWLGTACCLLFMAWFTSGIVMMYARMPHLAPAEGLARLSALDLASARLAPVDAARALNAVPERVRVGMLSGRPVYRFLERGVETTVFADDGQRLRGLTADEAVAEARRFAPERPSTVLYDARLDDVDQWTLEDRRLLPFHRVTLGDQLGTRIYVSDQTGEVVTKTTSMTRRWAYAGAVVHWLYFTPLRRHATLWSRVILALSLAGTVTCVLGLAWGVYSARQSPYAGWMRWHHLVGLVFGLTSFTWVFSGALSLEPLGWHPSRSPTTAQREAFSGGPLRLEAFSLDALRSAVRAGSQDPGVRPRELELLQFHGRPRVMIDGRAADDVDRNALTAAAREAMPGAAVEDVEWLDAYDAYYYDRDGELPLPVMRARFADAQRTWLYVDPRRAEIARKEERLTRLDRWLYHGLHSLDFPFLYYKRPLWDVVLISLSLGGLMSSVTVLVPVWRRLSRRGRRLYSWTRTREVSADASSRS